MQPVKTNQEIQPHTASKSLAHRLRNLTQGFGEPDEALTLNDQALEKLSIKVAVASSGLDFAKANQAEKMYRLVPEMGRETVHTLLCVTLKLFSHGIRSNDKLRNSEIVDLANDILEMYKYDSFEDITLALKQAAYNGEKFYHGLDKGKVFAVLNDYFAAKADWRADEEYKKKKRFEQAEPPRENDPEFMEGMERVRAELNKLSKMKTVHIRPDTSQSFFQSQLIDQLPHMTNQQLVEAKNSYEKQDRISFAKEIGWIEDEIKNRLGL